MALGLLVVVLPMHIVNWCCGRATLIWWIKGGSVLKNGKYLIVPARLEPPLPQQAILLTKSQSVAAARFLDYLKSNEAKGFMSDAGYRL